MKNKIGLILMIVLLWLIFIVRPNILEDNRQAFRDAKNVYCPRTYREVKGDGVFVADHMVVTSRERIEVVEVKGWNIYDDKNQSFPYNDCEIRE